MRTQEEIDEQLSKAADLNNAGKTRWSGMTYEQGVEDVLLWVTGVSDDAPMEDG